MFYGECWLVEGGLRGREDVFLGKGRGGGRERSRAICLRGGWGEKNLALGLRRGEEGTLQAQEATWSGAGKIMSQQEPAFMNE